MDGIFEIAIDDLCANLQAIKSMRKHASVLHARKFYMAPDHIRATSALMMDCAEAFDLFFSMAQVQAGVKAYSSVAAFVNDDLGNELNKCADEIEADEEQARAYRNQRDPDRQHDERAA